MPAPQSIDDLRALERLIAGMSPKDRANLDKITPRLRWVPLPGQQAAAYESLADVLLFGGSAGSGKTSLLNGLAATCHHRSLIARREASELDGLIAESRAILGSVGSYNGQDKEWSFDGDKSLKFGGMKEPDDWRKYAGRARDLMGLDEAAEFLEAQVASILAWNRSTDKEQRCRMVLATNPPRSAEGEWVLRWFAPWLDPTFPDPALPGELRWAIRVGDKLEWVAGPEVIVRDGEEYQPLSYTFIPGRLDDNPFLADTSYRKQLQNLPGALRGQLLHGDFLAGRADDEWQVIPTDWVKAAQARWKSSGANGLTMTAIGVDVAQGGDDETTIAHRYGHWYGEILVRPGKLTPDPPSVAGLVTMVRRGAAAIVVDLGGGYGGGVVSYLKDNEIKSVSGFNGSNTSTARTEDSGLTFFNKRAEAWWRMREALDPGQEGGSPIALPPDPVLLGDLAAPRWSLKTRGILIEDKDQIRKRLGRSTDRGDAVVMAWSEGEKIAARKHSRGTGTGGRPQVVVGYQRQKKR